MTVEKEEGLRELIWIGLAGAFGSLSRYTVSGWVYELLGRGFAYGTLVVNITGCFLLGLLMELSLTGDLVPPGLRMPLAAGFLGAFTTFSTFSYETMRYIEDGAWLLGLQNVAASLALGLLATWLGLSAARLMTGVS